MAREVQILSFCVSLVFPISFSLIIFPNRIEDVGLSHDARVAKVAINGKLASIPVVSVAVVLKTDENFTLPTSSSNISAIAYKWSLTHYSKSKLFIKKFLVRPNATIIDRMGIWRNTYIKDWK